MVSASIPSNEIQRLQSLKDLELLDTLPEQQFDELTYLASQVCGTPISLISLVDHSRQWFKSKVGLLAAETSRESSFCAHAILQDEIFVVSDALEDARFADNPLVIGNPKIRFYAGIPLSSNAGHKIGTLCVIDQEPRQLTTNQVMALTAIANQIVNQINLRYLLLKIESEKKASDNSLLERNKFFAHMSHEIRTPMNGVVGLADLLLESELSTDQRAKIDLIQHCGMTLIKLVSDILDFSKLENRKVHAERVPCNLRNITTDVVKLFEGNASKKNLIVRNEIDPSVPDLLFADDQKIRQILGNLFSNAIKFTPSGSIQVCTTLTNKPGEPFDHECRICVVDSGIGIAREDKDKIFESFEQATSSVSREFGGTGLGLTISRGLCRVMGGEMSVESNAGGGSTFSFSFKVSSKSSENISIEA